ncbi:MAG: Rv1355c family protein [Janthinobacterium lividum]
MKTIESLLAQSKELQQIYLPVILRLNEKSDKQTYKTLIEEDKVSFIHDEIYGQLQELIKINNPSKKITTDEYKKLIEEHINGSRIHEYGVWVYYPWVRKLIHVLDEIEFINVRTNRNQYKITKTEQDILKTKKIGIVGLSVGQSIALTMAMERTCGELRIADFDTVELSNMNRIRTSSYNLGLNKTIIAAREILEIDPFFNIKIFSDGLHTDNMDDFFLKDGKLDLFVEVCDGLDIKIESRFKAKELNIPVIMDTNDRGMLDVERYDLEPDRPILHGLADGLNPSNIKGLSNEEKIPYILKMIGADTISTRLKASMMEVEQSINTWPQLASSVVLGGALTTDVCRRILLNQYHDSGRYYLDMEDIVKDKNIELQKKALPKNPYLPLNHEDTKKIIALYFKSFASNRYSPEELQVEKIIDAAIAAPSAGNNQPWKWVFSRGILFLFHDKHKSWSWGDYFEMGAHMSLGTALENVHLQSTAMNLEDNITLFPIKEEPKLIASIYFNKIEDVINQDVIKSAEFIFKRNTNRKIESRQILDSNFFNTIKKNIANDEGINLFYIEDEKKLNELADIIGECDKMRLLNELGHEEFYHEIRWTNDEAKAKRDGIELKAVDITQSDFAGFKIAKDWKAVELLSIWNQGNAFKKLSLKSVKTASAIIVFTISEFNLENLVNAGRSIQKIWIATNQMNISIHPMLSPAFFFNRLTNGKGEGLTKSASDELEQLRTKFLSIFSINSTKNKPQNEVFIMKVSVSEDMGIKSFRKDKKDIFSKL